MNTSEINAALQDVQSYVGCFARDMLPVIVRRPACLVINMDKSEEPGSHWTCVLLHKDGRGEYFDSYGAPPYYKEITCFLERTCSKGFVSNREVLQTTAPFSLACGMYAILYLAVRTSGLPREFFFNLFTKDRLLNEILVRLYTLI